MQLSSNSAQNEGYSSEWKHLGTNSACCHCHKGEDTELWSFHGRNKDDNEYVRKDLDNFSIYELMKAFYLQTPGTT